MTIKEIEELHKYLSNIDTSNYNVYVLYAIEKNKSILSEELKIKENVLKILATEEIVECDTKIRELKGNDLEKYINENLELINRYNKVTSDINDLINIDIDVKLFTIDDSYLPDEINIDDMKAIMSFLK